MIYLYYYKLNKLVEVPELNYDKVVSNLYYEEARIPTEKELSKLNITIDEIKNNISKLNYHIPLFDPTSYNMYIIDKHNVYNRVMILHYRFPTNTFIEELTSEFNQLSKEIDVNNLKLKLTKDDYDDENYTSKHKQIFKNRKYHKLDLMLKFMKSYNLSVLEETYVKVFYYYSNEVGKNITLCKRPSYLSHFIHIKPFYTRAELINLALNMNIIKPSKKIYDVRETELLCDKIKKNDINADIILEHQNHIIKEGKIGLIQYYSLMGAYSINHYLRNSKEFTYKNNVLDKTITKLHELVRQSPSFDKKYILYRFIQNDDYLYGLKVGDIYVEKSFISTTRDPFYTVQEFKFGFILIKINIPEKMKGVGLCIESYSNFSNEEEIILPPGTKLKLESIDNNTPYYHVNTQFTKKVIKRYEFTIVGHEDLVIPYKIKTDSIKDISFIKARDDLSILNNFNMNFKDRINVFISRSCDENFQFKTTLAGIPKVFNLEYYNSSSVYNKFYYFKTQKGVSIYHLDEGNIRLIIEISDEDGGLMAVNYYSRYSNINYYNNTKIIEDNDLLDFIAEMAYYFNILKVIIFANYKSADIKIDEQKIAYGGRYCEDFYLYLSENKKRFNENIKSFELTEAFNYDELDKLKQVSPLDILKKDDKDELYQIYDKIYISLNPEKNNLNDFYLWIVKHHSYLINTLEEKMNRYYDIQYNPFNRAFYVFSPFTYLYNRKKIPFIQTEFNQGTEILSNNIMNTIINDIVSSSKKNVEAFNNRINTYRVSSNDRSHSL
jgi:hypothetical protein